MAFLAPKPKLPPVRPPQVLVPQNFAPNPSQPARPMTATGGSNDSNFKLGTQTLINQAGGTVAPAQKQRRTLLGGA